MTCKTCLNAYEQKARLSEASVQTATTVFFNNLPYYAINMEMIILLL